MATEFEIVDGVLKKYHGGGGAVQIPDGVTMIGNCAFDGCSELTGVEIPDTVTRIGSHAFRGCSGLKSMVIPKSVISIDSEAFLFCNRLSLFCETEEKPRLWSYQWNLVDYDEYEWFHDYHHPGQGMETRRANFRYVPTVWGYQKQ